MIPHKKFYLNSSRASEPPTKIQIEKALQSDIAFFGSTSKAITFVVADTSVAYRAAFLFRDNDVSLFQNAHTNQVIVLVTVQ